MKKILKSSIPIFITYLLSYLIVIISSIIYMILNGKNLDYFLNTVCPYILILFYIATILYLYRKNLKKEVGLKQYFPYIYIGISLATFLNMIIFKINPPTSTTTISLPLAIISSGIIGPIYEEILFRYVFYNRLKKFLKKKTAIFLTTLVFALIHLTPIKIVYAFIIGLVLNLVYEKEKNILSSILIHISANIIVLFLHEYNILVLILSLINLIISSKIIFQNNDYYSKNIFKKMM